MLLLICGVLLWSIMHFLPAADVGIRRALMAKIGENPYKGLFALLMFFSIFLVVSGWKSSSLEVVYLAPAWGRNLTALFMLAGFILFFAPYPPNNFKRFLRHPQLIGMICWGVGHLLSNGEMRSIVLFGGFAIWAALEILLINRRDGVWKKPEAVPFKNDIMLIVGGLVIYVAIMFSHQWLVGVSPMG
jgi:uncharacterized membrane protein